MASLFKRMFGRITGRRNPAEIDMTLIEPVVAIEPATPAAEPIDELIEKSGEIPALDDSTTPWEEVLATAEVNATPTLTDEGVAVTASLYTAPADESSFTTTSDDAAQTLSSSEVEATTALATIEAPIAVETTLINFTEIQIDAEAPAAPASETPIADEAPVFSTVEVPADVPAPAAIAATPAPVEAAKAPVEMKPEPAASPAPLTTLAELYDLISCEVNRRTDGTVAVYERLLAATREDLETSRRNNRVAWSVGGVMSAVAVFGAVWSSGEFAATHTELGTLKQQATAGRLASAERDQLRVELSRVREASARVELDALKGRLNEALAVSAERDRLQGELERVRRDRLEVESELRLARATATTQPVSDARTFLERTTARTTVAAAAGDKAAGAERPDVWSSLLNGRD